jgi:hypothetical protein
MSLRGVLDICIAVYSRSIFVFYSCTSAPLGHGIELSCTIPTFGTII